ncbi:thiolase family protein [Nonomuraea aurantiaca]|uniref:thiolase family protein n=1 Tax=Nonomuraea aurantiaca TaxID=2878562 RepID=UPI001CD91F44|nr:thiolase family protein [Nonomuraea aurantiaca]MCA2230319.1 thiolase family protein [Nonomuraea aurantiaca]
MRQVAVAGGMRTPFAKAGGAYADIHPADLLGTVLSALNIVDVDQVLIGCTQQGGDQSYNIARNAWLAAGLPIEVPASTIDTVCGSSQQTVNLAAALVASGQADVVVAGGVESLSRTPMFSTWGDGNPFSPRQLELYDMPNQGVAAERIARKYGVTREQSDEIGFRSHQRATAAWEEGRFDDEIIPIAGITRDNGIRPDADLARMAKLRPVYEDDGIVTAGSASQLSDGAAAVVVASDDACERLGLRPLAWIRGSVTVGVDPDLMLEGPLVATNRLLERFDLEPDDIARFELHEAYATVIGAWQNTINADSERVNPDGGAIAIGHPFGASGARQMLRLARHLSDSTDYGLQAMCCGGGIGTGTLLQGAG